VLLAGLVVVAFCGFVALAYFRRWAWTGFASPRKTLWDWLSLLVVPAALALGVFALDSAQADRAREREALQAARDHEIAADRDRADVLRTYLTQMSDLMLRHGLAKPRKEGREWDKPVEILATTLTASALAQLDGERKGEVLRFLSSARLIDGSYGSPKVSLAGADLHGVVARKQALVSVDLSGADLRDADLRDTIISVTAELTPSGGTALGPQFSEAVLSGADLRGAGIYGANFNSTDLTGADLSGTDIDSSTFMSACLAKTKFADASVRDVGFGSSQGAGTDFSGADLEGVRFRADEMEPEGHEDAALTDLVLTGTHRVRTEFPLEWGPQGLPLTASRKKTLCRTWGSGPAARNHASRFVGP
jgi:uncharacterized protein YjbI with pentapeptide repeats